MPSFDITAQVNWQELDNAVHQATKELTQRFDFKGIKTEIIIDAKEKTVTLWCGDESKLDDMNDILQNKLVKRGVSLLSLEYKPVDSAFGGSVRQLIQVQAGISKEKGKEIIAAVKESRLKVQAQIQDLQVRVTAKSRDDLQATMTYLKENQDRLKVPMNFENFRN